MTEPAQEQPETAPSETSTQPARRRVVLTGISSRAWEHPADRGALTALRELRGFDELIKGLSALWNERAWRLAFLGGAIRVDHRQYPRVHRLFAEAAATLDVEELRCLLGHELGHLLSGHAVYRTILDILTSLARRLLPIGGPTAVFVISSAMWEWWRKAELSADRAGLLASQDPAAALRLDMKLAGGGDLSEVDTAAFLEQAAEYDRTGDLRDSFIKLTFLLGRSHPLPVARAATLRQWIDSGEYGRILAGDYPRRDDDRGASVSDEAKAAAQSYRESFARSEDPLMSLLRRIRESDSGVGEWLGGSAARVRDWMGSAGSAARSSTRGNGSTEPTDQSG